MSVERLKEGRATVTARTGVWILEFFGALLLAKAGVFQQALPFGVALAVLLPLSKRGLPMIGGLLLGYALLPNDLAAVRYVACVVIVLGIRKLFAALGFYGDKFVDLVLAFSVVLATGIAEFIRQGGGAQAVVLVVCEALLGAGYCLILRLLERVKLPARPVGSLDIAERYSAAMTGFILLLGLGSISIGGYSPGQIAAGFLILALGVRGGPAVGCTAGVLAGVATLVTGQGELSFVVVSFAAMGLAAGLVRKLPRIPAAAVAAAAGAALGVLLGGTNAALPTAGLLTGAAFFALLPAPVFERLMRPAGEPEREREEQIGERLNRLSSALRELAQPQREKGENRGDISCVFSAAADHTCRNCGLNHYCWGKDYNRVMDTLMDAAETLRERGTLAPELLRDGALGRCVKLPEFVAQINLEYDRRYRRQVARISEQEEQLSGQFDAISSVLEGVSSGLRSGLVFDTELEQRLRRAAKEMGIRLKEITACVETDGALCVDICTGRFSAKPELCEEITELLRAETGAEFFEPSLRRTEDGYVQTYRQQPRLKLDVARAALKKEGEECSGDSSCVFESPDGRYCIMLSDGMGSGPEAAQESGFAVRCFEKLQKNGVTRESALKIINSALVSRRSECFATCDLMVVNRYSGEAEFIKAGAAPSLLVRGRKIHRIESGTLPSGILAEAETERSRCILEPGDLVVLMSDGVLQNGEELGFLREVILGHRTDAERSLAAEILAECRRRKPAPRDDDMTCFTVQVHEAETISSEREEIPSA